MADLSELPFDWADAVRRVLRGPKLEITVVGRDLPEEPCDPTTEASERPK